MAKSKLLVAVSSPWASERLVEPISQLLRRLGSAALVVHVARQQEEDERESDARQRGEQTLKLLADALREAGLEAEGLLLFSDDIPKAIINTAKARECSIIVMGLTGKGSLHRWFGRDVPRTVIRQVDLPVLLLPLSWRGSI